MTDKSIKKKCERHGYYDAKLLKIIGSKKRYSLCPECVAENNLYEKNLKLISKKEEKDQKKHIAKVMATIPDRYSSASFESFEVEIDKQAEAKYIANDYCSHFEEYKENGVNLIFFGFVGTGKTLLAAAIANELIAKFYSVKFTSVLKLVAELKGSYSENSPTSHNEIIEEHSQYDLLILDEIGVQNNTPWELNVLYELINRRYEKNYPSLVIANIDPKNLVDVKNPDTIIDEFLIRHLGLRVIDRLRENESLSMFFDWGSYRRKTYRKKT